MKDLWRRYRESKAITIDLGELGLEGCWVKVVPTTALSPGQLQRIVTATDTIEQQRVALREWVLDWNLPDADGKPLPLPGRSDAWLDVLPTELVIEIIKKVNAYGEGVLEGNPPKTPPSLQPSVGGAADQTG